MFSKNDTHDKAGKAAATSTKMRLRLHQRESKQYNHDADSAMAEQQPQKGSSIKGRKANAPPATTCSSNDDSSSWISDSSTPNAKHRHKAGDVPLPTQECSTVNLDDLSEPSFEEMDARCEYLSTASSAKSSSTAKGQKQEDEEDREDLFGRTYEPIKLLGKGEEKKSARDLFLIAIHWPP